MSTKIIRRAVASVPFGWRFVPGTQAVPERTVPYADAIRLGVTGTIVAAKDGAPVSVTVAAKDARPRSVRLSNALALTASNPTGKVSKSGVGLSDATLRETIAVHGWTTIGAMFPIDGTVPTTDARAAALASGESAAFAAYLRAAEEVTDTDTDTDAPSL